MIKQLVIFSSADQLKIRDFIGGIVDRHSDPGIKTIYRRSNTNRLNQENRKNYNTAQDTTD